MTCARQIVIPFAFAIGGWLVACDDDTPANTINDAAMDVAVDVGSTLMPGSNSDVAVTNGVTTLDSGAELPVNTKLDAAVSTEEFSWSIDPMSIVLQRGTCRTVTVNVKRHPDYNGPITLGVGGGAEKVGFGSNHIEAGASTGSFVLVTAANAPAVSAAPLTVAATGNKTHLRLTVLLTVTDTAPVTDGGVLDPAGVDGSVYDEPTCRLVVGGLGK